MNEVTKEFGKIILYLLSFALFIYFALWIFFPWFVKVTYTEIPEHDCEWYKDYTIDRTPVKCFDYFKLNNK